MKIMSLLKDFNSTFSSSRGFSIAGVLIGAGLAGGLALIVAQISKNMSIVNQRAFSSSAELELSKQVSSIMRNKNFCRVSLEGRTFRKSEIDNGGIDISGSDYAMSGEGLNIPIWLSNLDGSARTHKKFNGANFPENEDKSNFGKLKIQSLKMVMNNGPGSCSENYCEGTASDIGQIVIFYEKKSGKKIISRRKVFENLQVTFETDDTGVSTITGCALMGSDSSGDGLSPWRMVTGPEALEDGDRIFVDTSSGAFSVTLPTSPNAGDHIQFVDVSGQFESNNLTIIPASGDPIHGGADGESLICDVNEISFGLVFINDTLGWRLQ